MSIRRGDGLAQQEHTGAIIRAFFEVYNELGFGFLESMYASALEQEIRAGGRSVGREVGVRILYKGREVAWQRVDMLVAGSVVVEIKATPKLAESAAPQLLNYLRATHLQVGLLLHFGPKPSFFRIYAHTHPQKSVHPELSAKSV